MARKDVYSLCGMCSVRCPIMVEVEDGAVRFIQGNPKDAGMRGALCPRGAAGYALTTDAERPSQPLIRDGARGEGKWKAVTWDEALAYVADKLKSVMAEHGPQSVLWSDRGGPFVDLHQAFVRGLGSPNYCNHDVSCARNVQHAALSVSGMGRKEFIYDYKNAKHIVLQTRNIFEAINVKEVNGVLDCLGNGGTLSVIDVRATVSASKAQNFFMIRPGTDYAFNLAVINELLEKNLYDAAYAEKHINGLDTLREFAAPYTPEWAVSETGVPAAVLRKFVKELVQAAPAVIWHPGWMTARYSDSFYVSRTAYLINALLGSIGAKGGLAVTNTAKDVGRKGLKKFAELYEKPAIPRADGAGGVLKHIDAGPGLLHKAFEAMTTGSPYPIKAYIIHRHDPLMAMPDPEAIKKAWDNLELIVANTFSWSDSAWYADVVLPMSTYLERDSIIAGGSGLKPMFFRRDRAIEPLNDTRADWEIIRDLAKAMGIEKLAFESLEAMRDYQLTDTGVARADFEASGQVPLCAAPVYKDMDQFSFNTPSGKLEVVNGKWESMGLPSLKPYESPARPEQDAFRITFGRCALHTQGHTVNNALLSQKMPENVLWMHTSRASALGVKDGDTVALEGTAGKGDGRLKAFVTDFIHPEAVFLVHGFGHDLPVESRARGKGAADQTLMVGGLAKEDPAGGGLALQEHFVRVRKV